MGLNFNCRSYVKTKAPRKIYKIQKTFRFRNYRLRCIRLRRQSRQQINSNLSFNLFKNSKLTNFLNSQKSDKKIYSFNENLSNENTVVSSSGCISSADSNENSNISVTSNSFVSTSLSSASDNEFDASSLTECFKSTKFLNSSDQKEEEENEKKNYLNSLLE